METSEDVDASAGLPADGTSVTDLLVAWGDGTVDGEEALFREIYDDLHELAGGMLWSERRHHTLQPTALLHEAFLRLARRRSTAWTDRRHFFATAAQAMRRILIDYARRRTSLKRNRGEEPVSSTAASSTAASSTAASSTVISGPSSDRDHQLIALDDALRDLRSVDPFKAKLVDLRFFAGFSIPETADILGCSKATIERHWRVAQGWLYRELNQNEVR